MNCQLFAFVVYLVNTKFQLRQLIALLKAMDSKLLGKSFRYRFYSTYYFRARNGKTKYLEVIRVIFCFCRICPLVWPLMITSSLRTRNSFAKRCVGTTRYSTSSQVSPRWCQVISQSRQLCGLTPATEQKSELADMLSKPRGRPLVLWSK